MWIEESGSAAKLATARQLSEATASHSLGAVLELGEVDEDELYRALDLLGAAQPAIQRALARRHLKNGTLVLCAVTSSDLEGRCCELARRGYSRDGRPQIVFGLLCAADGCPVAVAVFEGDTGDPKTLATQIDKLKKRFGLKRVVLVGDRGMITSARIEQDLKPAGLDWITVLRAPAIEALAADGGPLQLSLFDEKEMAEIASPDYPDERLILCRNPLLAAERARKREDLLAATERDLAKIQAATGRPHHPPRGRDTIALKVGTVLGRRKVGKPPANCRRASRTSILRHPTPSGWCSRRGPRLSQGCRDTQVGAAGRERCMVRDPNQAGSRSSPTGLAPRPTEGQPQHHPGLDGDARIVWGRLRQPVCAGVHAASASGVTWNLKTAVPLKRRVALYSAQLASL